MTGVGTSAMPIFVRGVGAAVAAIPDVGYYGNASYIIVEGLSFLGASSWPAEWVSI